MRKLLPSFLGLLMSLSLSLGASAQTFTGTTVSIPDSGDARVGFSAVGLSANLSTSFGLERICFNIQHLDVSTLELILVSPAGVEVELASVIDHQGANFLNTCLDGVSDTIVNQAYPPYGRTYRAEGQLGRVNEAGGSGNGTWILIIRDLKRDGLSGDANNCSITFSTNPAKVFKLTQSHLPIVTINTRGQVIPDDPKVNVRMGIINNGAGRMNYITDFPNAYWGEVGIELRGKSSQEFPKKPYSLELRDTLGEERKVALLGMPSEADWVMIPNWTDKTQMRNSMTYEISRQMGQYATRGRFVELVLNGEYQGTFVFGERLKRNDNRVNISKMEAADTNGANVTGGYIIKLDKLDSANAPGWYSTYPANNRTELPFIQYEYPKPEDIQPQQKNYIRQYMATFEDALYGPNYADPATGYAAYIDVMSFIDYFFLQELGRNVDAYRFSTYLHKLKSTRGGKLRMGPIWDMDIAYGNLNFSSGPITTGWRFQDTTSGAAFPGWYNRFMTDTNYVRMMRCRWITLRQGVLSQANIYRIIDSSATVLDSAQQRNFRWWPIMGSYVWPNPQPIQPNYAAEVAYLKNWIGQRLTWMDGAIGTVCTPPLVSLSKEEDAQVALYPNPATSTIQLRLPYSGTSTIRIADAMGRVYSSETHEFGVDSPATLSVANLPAGVYLMRIQQGNWQTVRRFVKQ